MRIRAKHSIDDGKVHLPGTIFEVDDDTGQELIDAGSAEETEEPADKKAAATKKAKGK